MTQRTAQEIGVRQGPERGLSRAIFLLLFPLALMLGVVWAAGGLEYGHWWLMNTTPPSLSLAGPTDVVRGTVQVGIQVGPSGRVRVVEVQVDGRPVDLEEPLAVDTAILPDGEHRVAVTAEDDSRRRNRASAAIGIHSDNTPPRLLLESRPDRTPQGHTWLLRIRANEPAAVEASLDGKPLDLQNGDGFGWTVVGVGPDAEPTSIPLVVAGTDRVGNRAEEQAAVQVTPHNFPRDRLEVPADLLPLLDPRVRDDEDAQLAPTYARVTRPRLWDGRFLLPVEGPIITQFGEIRSYNGGPPTGHHGGVDFAAAAGRPVLAPAQGRVALVDQARLRGTVIVLDHGLGVFTTYAHLSEVDVHIGQEVQRGQPIGKVGSTGLSTGPHLHWELRVGGVLVNPLEWTERSLP